MKTAIRFSMTLCICLMGCRMAYSQDNKNEEHLSADARITQVRADACTSLLKGVRSCPADESFRLCIEAFRIADSGELSTLLKKYGFAEVLARDSLYDARTYRVLPKRPADGERVYLLKLPSWKKTDYGIYLYFSQKSSGDVNLHNDSRDTLLYAIVPEGIRSPVPSKSAEVQGLKGPSTDEKQVE